MEKSVVIVGLGALGGAVAGLLARAGVPVAGVCRSRADREAIESRGLLLREQAEETVVRFPVLQEISAETDAALVMVLVKAFDTEPIARSLRDRMDERTPVLTLQNGLGNAETLSAVLKPDQVLAGTITFGALREAPGVVRLTGRGECELGAWHERAQQHLPRVKELLERGGLPCRLSSNIVAALWKKLAANAVINPLTALLRVRNGELLEQGALEPLFTMIVEEVWQTAARRRIALPAPPELAAEVRRVCQLTAANESSMLRDVLQQRRTEIDAINGAVARLARERGVLAPLNQALAALVQVASRQQRAPVAMVPECR
jgi:2-dehydropantoate 2-reductase